jgi:hypothetical protein
VGKEGHEGDIGIRKWGLMILEEEEEGTNRGKN